MESEDKNLSTSEEVADQSIKKIPTTMKTDDTKELDGDIQDKFNEDKETKTSNDDDKEDTFDLSEELANVDDNDDSFGSLSDEDIDDDDKLQGDTWIEELECALLADCDPATLKKISEGRRIPSTLRADFWRALLSLDEGKVKLTNEYNLENQLEMRDDCEQLVEDIAVNLAKDPLSDTDKLKLRSDFESTLTTYVKARPELRYVRGNGWIDILKVLYQIELDDCSQLYQMFFRIVDRYIPKGLSATQSVQDAAANNAAQIQSPKSKKSVQAYHLLRLLIQYHDPELCSILDSRKVGPDLYAKDWFCSLFARSCSPKTALIIWDTHFKMADPFLIFFAAIVMVVNASDELKLSNMTQTNMLNVLKMTPSKLQEDDIEDLYYLVSNYYTFSTPKSIRTYSHLFFLDTFGNTYLGNESPEDGQPFVDLRTTKLTNSLDLSQYLCLPIVPAEIFAIETAKQRSPNHSNQSSPSQSAATMLQFFLVDCRPAEQYNAGHLKRAFHLDCSLMLREPASFATAVQSLSEIQRQIVASKSATGSQHLCFIGSGQEEEDRYVNMVVASYLQKHQKYVSIVVGGFDAIHEYVAQKSELKDSFNKYIVDHNPSLCKTCVSKQSPEAVAARISELARLKNSSTTSVGSAQSLLASTTNFLRAATADKTAALGKSPSQNTFNRLTSSGQAALLAQSGASMFDKFTTAFVSKSNVIKDRLVETLNTTSLPTAVSNLAAVATADTPPRGHVSSQDRGLARRYTGSSGAGANSKFTIDDVTDGNDLARRVGLLDAEQTSPHSLSESNEPEPLQEVQLDNWRQQADLIAFYKCTQLKNQNKYPGYVALSRTHMWILREIPHNKGFVSIAAERPLNMIVQIVSKRRQRDVMIFRYGHTDDTDPQSANKDQQPNTKKLPPIIASDTVHIPQYVDLLQLIKCEIAKEQARNKAKSSADSRPDGADNDRTEANSKPEAIFQEADSVRDSDTKHTSND